MTTPPPPTADQGPFRPPPSLEPLPATTNTATFRHTSLNEETTVLTPVTAATNILDRIPLSERKRWKLVAGSAAGLAVLGLGFSIYLWVINSEWQTRADALTTEAYDLGQRLSDTRNQIIDMQSEIDLLTQQLETAQARVIELADEKAQVGDDITYSQQQIALYQELSALGGSVSLALNNCVNEHEKLAGYLKDPAAWNPDDLAAYEADVNALCNSAQSANATLQRTLTE